MKTQYLVNDVTPTVTAQAIHDRTQILAKQIARDYQDKEVILVGILKGAYMFLADLARALWHAGLTDFEIDFMGISSYGRNTESSRNPKITKDLDGDIRHRHVLIVEDIIETGYSLDALTRMLKERHTSSLEAIVLLSKESNRQINVPVKYIGFKVEGWIEGYGLDTVEKFRGRPEVVVRQT